MGAPRKLWKTTINVWTDYDPQGLNPIHLMRDAATSGHIESRSSELISNPYDQEDRPPREAFETEET